MYGTEKYGKKIGVMEQFNTLLVMVLLLNYNI